MLVPSSATSSLHSVDRSTGHHATQDENLPLVEPCGRHELVAFENSRQLPVHKTFIHFNVRMSDLIDELTPPGVSQVPQIQWDSAPAQMLHVPFHTKWPEHEMKHIKKECKPCAYHFKRDGCRWGAQCAFCHLCPKKEIMVRKKEKLRALRRQEQLILQQRLLATATHTLPKTGTVVPGTSAEEEQEANSDQTSTGSACLA